MNAEYQRKALGTSLEDMPQVGVKLDTGKPPMELLDPYALEQVALVLEFGRKKYSAHNWRKGIVYGRLAGAALRHIFAFLRGEDNDQESGLSHIAHAMCCLMFLLGMTRTRTDMDDRWRDENKLPKDFFKFRDPRKSLEAEAAYNKWCAEGFAPNAFNWGAYE